MDNLKEIALKQIEGYTGRAFNGYSYLTSNIEQNHFVVMFVGKVKSERIVNIGLIVELVGDMIIIDEDINTKPLVDALVQAGVPREQIILAYEGEPVPEPA